jgi:hypothetical protein
MRRFRLSGLLLTVAGTLALQAQTASLVVERRGGFLDLHAPQLHFLEGKPLEQLRNGASVTYIFELTLVSDQKTVTRLQERFILSFDLWEERFSIVRPGSAGRSSSHLTAAMAEAWCLSNLRTPVPAIGPEKSFVLKLDCRTAGDESEGESSDSSSLTLASLIDALSRKARDAPPRWQAVSGPLRLADLYEPKKQ